MQRTGSEKLKEETSNLLNAFRDLSSNSTAQNFRAVGPEDLHIVEHSAKVTILV